MDKMEILKLAFEKSADGKEAMQLAREIEAFLAPTKAIPPVQNALPLWVQHSPPPEQPAAHKPGHNRKPWLVEELTKMDDLLKAGKTPAQIALQLSRSEKAVLSAIYRVKTGEYFGGPAQ
jgi:DNA-binding NarL/FixJ family response regulator